MRRVEVPIACRGVYRARPGPSSLFWAPLVPRWLVEALDEAIAVVVERQTEREDDRHEGDRVDVLLLGHVRAEVRGDPGARNPREGRDDGEEPEGHRADPEEVRDDVLREPGDEVEDEADDRALRLEDEVHPVPVVLAEPRPDERLAPLAPHPETEERAQRQADRGIEEPEPRSEERPTDRPGDLAGDRRDDDLERLDRDEDERRHPAPRPHPVPEELLVLVEADEEPDDRSVHDDEPDDDDEQREQHRRDDRPARAIRHRRTWSAASQRRTA